MKEQMENEVMGPQGVPVGDSILHIVSFLPGSVPSMFSVYHDQPQINSK